MTDPRYLPGSDKHMDMADPKDCPCRPVLEYVTADGCEVWAHRDDDGGLPDPVTVMLAIAEASDYEVEA